MSIFSVFPYIRLEKLTKEKKLKPLKEFRNRGLGTLSVPSADAEKIPKGLLVFPSVFHSGGREHREDRLRLIIIYPVIYLLHLKVRTAYKLCTVLAIGEFARIHIDKFIIFKIIDCDRNI